MLHFRSKKIRTLNDYRGHDMKKKPKDQKQKSLSGRIFVICRARVSSVSHGDCHPSCCHLKTIAAQNGQKRKRQCWLDPDHPVDLKPIRKRIETEDLDSFQAARRCKICIDTENAIIEWRIRDRLSRLVGGI